MERKALNTAPAETLLCQTTGVLFYLWLKLRIRGPRSLLKSPKTYVEMTFYAVISTNEIYAKKRNLGLFNLQVTPP